MSFLRDTAANEKRFMRKKFRGRTTVQDDLIRSSLYGLQMIIAYFLMLVAMLYESFLFMTLVAGLIAGHFVNLRRSQSPDTLDERGESLWEEPVNYNGHAGMASGRTPCCGGS
mmetsp:Transcript_70090/g.186744  ORF Transcript_70090/g.186744 Transcript_70090/m.186744 type:complete len:113 (-) Transcript_70090:14-352(-)